MNLVVTLLSPSGSSQEAARAARAALEAAGGDVTAHALLDPPFAEDLLVRGLTAPAARAALEAVAQDADVVVQPADAPRFKRLMVADMDSTIIGQECIDELADYAGKRHEIAAITEAAMRGELDFEAALDARVAALAGLEARAIERALAERIRLNPGARTLLATLRAHGCRTVLVSGGFTAFTQTVASWAGFDRQVANHLELVDGRLAGTVRKPIVDSAVKRQILLEERAVLALSEGATLAIGDGANDIPMIEAAGLGIAFHAKPRTAAAADAHLRLCDLSAILWVMGLPRAQWREG
jgi:phosphoserine phosphatase